MKEKEHGGAVRAEKFDLQTEASEKKKNTKHLNSIQKM